MKRKWLIAVIVVLLAVGSLGFYSQIYLPSQVVPTQTYNSTKVRSGDISITASGIGSILPSEKVSVGFQMSGILTEVNIKIGDQVSAGQAIAKLASLDTQAQMATDQLNLLTAQQAVDDLYNNLKSEQVSAQAALVTAQKNLSDAAYNLNIYTNQRCDPASVTLYNGDLALAQIKYDEELADFNSNYASLPDTDERKIVAYTRLYNAQVALNTAKYTIAYCTGAADTWTTDDLKASAAISQAAYDTAKAKVEALKNGPDAAKLALAQAKLEQAKIQLETTREDLKKTTLTAPVAGTVTALNATVGQAISTSPFVTIETLDKMLLRFYIEEKDIHLVKVGNPVEVLFKAFPEITVKGQVTTIEPALQTIDGDLAGVAWALLDKSTAISLLSGMSAEVEVIAGEAKNALLVPVQALRQLAPGSYAVFIIQADGTLKMTPVTVGLKDFANAQILTGVKVGDVVSTGAVETK